MITPENTTPGTEDATTSRPARPGTIVWGALVTLIGIGALLWSTGVRFDPAVAASVVLGVAGAALVVTSVIRAARRR